MKNNTKHENYEILNLLGYGLSKFNNDFVKEFGFKTKTSFYEYFVSLGICETIGVLKNRMDLFDPFFDNGRQGWWQKGDAYIHRKIKIDSLFGNANSIEYANIVKFYLWEKYQIQQGENKVKISPLIQSKFYKLQSTGLEAESFFFHNYLTLPFFKNGILEDARLYGDGYDFQITVNEDFFLVEIKGIREKIGKFRLTEKEYHKAKKYQDQYIVCVVFNLSEFPLIKLIQNPLQSLDFTEIKIREKIKIEYHLSQNISVN